MKHEKKTIAIVGLVVLGLLIFSIPQAKAQFVLASWSYPDEYGQGIDFINVYENSTGSWVLVSHPTCGNSIDPDETAVFNWTIGVFMKIRCGITLNATLTGASSVADGKNFLRLNATVLNAASSVVFTQQNFTYVSGNDFGLYWYDYDCILNFLPVSGEYYTLSVLYEVFW